MRGGTKKGKGVSGRVKYVLLVTFISLIIMAAGVLLIQKKSMGGNTGKGANIIIGPCEQNLGEGHTYCGEKIMFRVLSPKKLEEGKYDGKRVELIGKIGELSLDEMCVRQVTLLEKPTSGRLPIVIVDSSNSDRVRIRYFDVNKCVLILPTGKELR